MPGLNYSDSGLAMLMEQDPQLYQDVLVRLAAMDFVGAVRVVATAAGMPPWAFNGLQSLLAGDMQGARAAVESALGSSEVQAYVGLALTYAINASGVPPSVLSSSPEIVHGAIEGNVTAVLYALAGAYGLEPWATSVLVLLVDAARSGSASELSSLATSDAASSGLIAVLAAHNVSVKMEAIGLASEYASAVAAGDVGRIASLMALTIAANPPRCALERLLSRSLVHTRCSKRAYNRMSAVYISRTHASSCVVRDRLPGLNYSDSGLAMLMEQDPQLYQDVLVRLAAMDFVGAVRVVATAAGMPPWAFNGLQSLLAGDMQGARAAVESALGSSEVQAYVGLALTYAINASGVPPSVLSSSPEIVHGAIEGNVTAVLYALAGAYGLEPWATSVLVLLVDAARSGSASELSSLATSDAASSGLIAVLAAHNVSVKMEAIGLASEYASAVAAGDVGRIASLMALTIAANPPRCVPRSAALIRAPP